MLRSLFLALVIVGGFLVLMAGAFDGPKSWQDITTILSPVMTNIMSAWNAPTRVIVMPTPRAVTATMAPQSPNVPARSPEPQTRPATNQTLQQEAVQQPVQPEPSLSKQQVAMPRVTAPAAPVPMAPAPAPVPPAPQPVLAPVPVPAPPQTEATQRPAPPQTVAPQPAPQQQAARRPAPDQPPARPQRALPQTIGPASSYDATQPVVVTSPSANLATARQLLVSGRTAEARDLLARAQTQMVLQPVTPDQPDARNGNVAATQVGNAIRLLDQGRTGSAIDAVGVAMGMTAGEQQTGAAQVPRPYPAAGPPGYYAYPPPSAPPPYGYGLR